MSRTRKLFSPIVTFATAVGVFLFANPAFAQAMETDLTRPATPPG